MSDIKYLNQISNQLSLFEKTPKRYKFRCPFCGDNKKHLTKTNGSVYEVNDKLVFKCYLCQKQGFGDLLELVNKNVFNEYMKEKYPQTKSNKKELLMEQERILALHQIEHQKRVSEFRKHLQKLNLSLKDKFLV